MSAHDLATVGGQLSLRVVELDPSGRRRNEPRFNDLDVKRYVQLQLENAAEYFLFDADDCFRLANKLNDLGAQVDRKKR